MHIKPKTQNPIKPSNPNVKVNIVKSNKQLLKTQMSKIKHKQSESANHKPQAKVTIQIIQA